VEEQLESVNLFSKLGPLLGDIGPKFHEARHTKGFNRISAGHKWAIHPADTPDTKGAPVVVGEDMLTALHELNKAQHEYDNKYNELVSLKEQLYMDWVKYMRLSYPLPDEIDNNLLERAAKYLLTRILPEVQQCAGECGEVEIIKSDGKFDQSDSMNWLSGNEQSVAYRLHTSWSNLETLLSKQADRLILAVQAANYYWQPKPPVILLSGLFSEQSDVDILRKAGDNNRKIYFGDATLIYSGDDGNRPVPNGNTQKLSDQITNPFILEWEFNLTDTALLRDEKGEIDAEALTTCVQIKAKGPDFEKTGYYQTGELSVFSGSIIMSPHARRAMVHKILDFVKANKADFFGDDTQTQNIFLNTTDLGAFTQALQNLIAKFSNQPDTANYRVLLELENLLHDHSILSQSLSGFNHACMMQGMNAQLPVMDPMGFDNTRAITQKVAELTNSIKRYSPLLANLFNPIRSGSIAVNRLNLIDNFGLVTEVKTPTTPVKVTWAETMLDNKREPFLHPRLTQPARLQFEMLDAAQTTADTNGKDFHQLVRSHNLPENSPICGWLVPDYLNNGLMVFGPNGVALGELDNDADWKKPPAATAGHDIEKDISNEPLRWVVKWLLGKSDLLTAFLDSIQSAQDNIAPANANHYKSQAILMGKPIAVVRAALHFQLMGLPAINQSWDALIRDISNSEAATDLSNKAEYSKREKNNWTNVQIPFRLGEHQQLDDGLLGYWFEDNLATADAEFTHKMVAPESSNPNPNDLIDTFTSNNKQQETINFNETKIFTLLIDPRSGVHCTSGIVPTVKTTIAPALYLPALQKLEMWFRVFPLLQPTETLTKDAVLNLPAIEGKEWHWYDGFGNPRNTVTDETDGFHLTPNTLTESFLTLSNLNKK